ncbi:hypothetical protein G4D82_07485 [Flavobacterium sp. CYK-4]|uniref:hypothetical protein n=1 Tax=Flavobacterium lotistagni TaxID=2709660 RepID=UPI0014088502|nr:hypothetical protein [Flavobacterium lotistagni]NHM07060.1 hypothetical protein [Flavobacterium lotistagni]
MKTFKLDEHPKITSGFKIPDGYFDGLQEKIQQKIDHEPTPVIALHSNKKTWIWAAAAVLIIATGIPLANYLSQPNVEIDSTTLENYLVRHTEISNEDIVELMDDEEIAKIRVDMKLEDRELEEALSGVNTIEDCLIN